MWAVAAITAHPATRYLTAPEAWEDMLPVKAWSRGSDLRTLLPLDRWTHHVWHWGAAGSRAQPRLLQQEAQRAQRPLSLYCLPCLQQAGYALHQGPVLTLHASRVLGICDSPNHVKVDETTGCTSAATSRGVMFT